MIINRTFDRFGHPWHAETESDKAGHVLSTTTLHGDYGTEDGMMGITVYLQPSGALWLFAHDGEGHVLVTLPADALETVLTDLRTVTRTYEEACEDEDTGPVAGDVEWLLSVTYSDHVAYPGGDYTGYPY